MLATFLRRTTRNHLRKVSSCLVNKCTDKKDAPPTKDILQNAEQVINSNRSHNITENNGVHKNAQIEVINTKYDIIDTRNMPNDDFLDVKFEKKSALDHYDEDINDVAPYLKPTFNFAAYINKSSTLQKLLDIGVELYKLERNPDIMQFILGLNFERDVKDHVLFFTDLGLEVDTVGKIITKNPFILKISLEDIQIRVNYLEYKKFSKDMILRILSLNASWLTYSTREIDEKLGFFQSKFKLTGNQVRQLAVKQPKLITYDLGHVKQNTFSLHEEMGFTDEELKAILLNKPKMFMKNCKNMLDTFDYVHNTLKIPLEVIVKFPDILTCRVHRLKERHLFLEKLGMIQFNAKLPNYISITSIVSGTDAEFCENVAKSSVQMYNTFLKTL